MKIVRNGNHQIQWFDLDIFKYLVEEYSNNKHEVPISVYQIS